MTKTKHLDDRILIDRIAQRDQSAAALLFDRHSDEIFRYLARRISYHEAEDLLQEVFARALRRASTFRGDSSARTWLFAFARLILLEKRRDRIHATDQLNLIEPGPGPESLLLRSENARQLMVALERLPDEQAIVFELHRIDGLQHDEIAGLLGIAAGTSRKRLQRATDAVSRALDNPSTNKSPRHQHVESWARSLRARRTAGGASQ